MARKPGAGSNVLPLLAGVTASPGEAVAVAVAAVVAAAKTLDAEKLVKDIIRWRSCGSTQAPDQSSEAPRRQTRCGSGGGGTCWCSTSMGSERGGGGEVPSGAGNEVMMIVPHASNHTSSACYRGGGQWLLEWWSGSFFGECAVGCTCLSVVRWVVGKRDGWLVGRTHAARSCRQASAQSG